MIDWMTVAFMFSIFINACLCGCVIYLVIQLAQLLNPNLYRRQVISNREKNKKTEKDPGDLKLKAATLGAVGGKVETDGESLLKQFIKEA